MPTVDIETHDEEVSNKIKYDDVDLSEYSDDELIALGLTEEEVRAIRDSEEDTEEEEEEDTEEEEVEEEEEEEVEEEPEEKKPSKEPRIPKSRFDEAVNKEREKAIRAEERARYLEERIEQLVSMQEQMSRKTETPAVVEPEFDFDAAEDKYAELLLEGDVQEASKLRKQMEKEREKRLIKLLDEVKKDARKASKDLSEAEKKELVIQEALQKYSFLDHASDEYDADLVEEINYIAAGYEISKKMSPHEAMKKAIDRVVKRETKPEEKIERPERTAKKKQAMKTQPPEVTSSKSAKDKTVTEFDWENMSQEEFSRLYKKSPKLVQEALRKTYI
jgi:hypothetical protein